MRKVLAASLFSVSLSVLLSPSVYAFGINSLSSQTDTDVEDLPNSADNLSFLADSQSSSAQVVSDLASPVAQAIGVASSLGEGFSDISTLAGNGWAFQNNSSPAPVATTATANWNQGVVSPFTVTAEAGSQDSYIYADPSSLGSIPGSYSNWLITPELDFSQGGIFSFFTRTVIGEGATFFHNLEIRQSNNGFSTNVGTAATDVGDFTIRQLVVGSLDGSVTYPGNYPGDAVNAWQKFTISIAPTGKSGRLAFHSYYPNATGSPESGGTGQQGFIAIDTVSYAATVPEPAASAFSGFAILGLTSYVKRKRSLIHSPVKK
jgi:hypothetical protein